MSRYTLEETATAAKGKPWCIGNLPIGNPLPNFAGEMTRCETPRYFIGIDWDRTYWVVPVDKRIEWREWTEGTNRGMVQSPPTWAKPACAGLSNITFERPDGLH